jgi:hypothetical protein
VAHHRGWRAHPGSRQHDGTTGQQLLGATGTLLTRQAFARRPRLPDGEVVAKAVAAGQLAIG